MKISSWTWTYELIPISEESTRVSIEYRWGLMLSFLALSTAGHQAANEITETAMALNALGFKEQKTQIAC